MYKIFLPSIRFVFRWQSVSISCLLLLVAVSLSPDVQAQVTGKVFRDFNANGIQNTPISSTASAVGEPGVPGILVTAYPATGSPLSVSTAIDGSYSFPNSGITASGAKLRLEFSGLTTGLYSAAYGTATTGSGTSIQFVTAGSSATANYGVNYPGEFCDSSPMLTVPCFVSGSATASGVAGEHVVVTFPYTASTTNTGTQAAPVPSNSINPTPIADAGQVGSVWGMAYQRETNKLFSAAFLKRHVGLGTGGLGGIYVTNNANGSTANGTLYVDLEAAPFSLNLGQSLIATRTLPATPTASSTDPSTFSLIGAAGLGSLAISDDGTKLYVVDLFNRQLLVLNIGNQAKATLSASDLTTIALPATSCTNGVARPFAVAVRHGKVYVGVVCTGENAGATAANLSATIYEMDEATQVFSPTNVFTAPLNYPKGWVHAQQTALGSVWETWTASFSTMNTTQLSAAGATPVVFRTAQPQPILSDIDFTDNGDMVISLMDRAGHQLGYRQVSPTGGSTLYSGYVGGDLLRARKQGSSWVLETAGRVSSTTSGTLIGCGPTNTQGPGSGEFYCRDNYGTDNDGNGTVEEVHQETAQGGALILAGTNHTVAIHMDPMTTWSGGTIWHNNTTGALQRVYQLYRTIDGTGAQVNGTYGKANGLGLPVALCDPAPVEIGNRIWLDSDKDGIQDPAETPIASVSVGLYNSGTLVATAVTNAKGEYYFSSATGTSSTAVRYNLALIRGGAYELRILTTQPALSAYQTNSPANAGGNESIDNDFTVSGNNMVTSLTVGMSGNNLHLFDAAVAPVDPCSLTLAALPGACDPATNGYTLSGTITLANSNTAGSATVTDGVRSTTVSVPSGATSVVWSLTGFASDGASHTAIVTLTNCGTASTTYAAPASCTACSLSITTTSLPDGQIGAAYSQSIAATGGTGSLTYTVSGGSLPTGLNLGASTGIISGTPIAAATTSFTVKVTDTKGCTAVVPLTITTSALPVCSLIVLAAPGSCVPATNTYAVTGTISLTNNTAGGIATITDGSATTTVIIAANATSANFTLSGLLSDVTTHLVSVSLIGCGTSSMTYAAPVSCSVAAAKASLGDFVWLDTNKNGQQDGTETGVQNVTAVLCDAVSGSVISTTLTDAQGKYLFSNLDPGSYVVKFTAPTGTTFTTPNSGTDATDSDVASVTGQKGSTGVYSLSAGEQNLTVDAGLVPLLGSIGDFVWKDANGNGIQDDGPNSGMSNVRVNLLKETSTPGQFTVVATTITSTSGLYNFTGLSAGNYKIQVDLGTVPFYCQPTAQTVVTPNDAINSKIDDLGLTPVIVINPANPAQQDYPKADAGFSPLPLGSIGDYVWKDTNNDGIQNDGATGVPNVGLKLLDSDGNYIITNVLSGGQENPAVPTSGTGLVYAGFNPTTNQLDLMVGFSNLNGTVTMAHIHTGVVGTNGPVLIDLVPLGFPTGVQAGNFTVTTTLTAAQETLLLGNKLYVNVHTSTNGGGEVRAQLVTCAFSNTAGAYLFSNLPQDSYTVAVDTPTLPATCVVSSKQNSISATEATDSDFNPITGLSDPVVVIPSDPAQRDIRTVDLALVAPTTGSIGDLVWKDLVQDGRYDATTELGVAGISVRLLEVTSPVGATVVSTSLVSTTQTGSNGLYLFTGLPTGRYIVEIDRAALPTNCVFSPDNQGPGIPPDLNSDIDPGTGRSPIIELVVGDPTKQNIVTIDAALINQPCPTPAKCVPITVQRVVR